MAVPADRQKLIIPLLFAGGSAAGGGDCLAYFVVAS